MEEFVPIQTVLFAVSVLAMIFVVIPIYKSLVTGYIRDKLFAQRDALRQYCLENDIPLDGRKYVQMRRLINSHLRFLENVNFSSLRYWKKTFDNHPDLREYSQNLLDSAVASDNVEQQKYLGGVRQNAEFLVFVYLMLTSFRMMAINLAVVVLFVCRTIVQLVASMMCENKHAGQKPDVRIEDEINFGHEHIEEASWLSHQTRYMQAA